MALPGQRRGQGRLPGCPVVGSGWLSSNSSPASCRKASPRSSPGRCGHSGGFRMRSVQLRLHQPVELDPSASPAARSIDRRCCSDAWPRLRRVVDLGEHRRPSPEPQATSASAQHHECLGVEREGAERRQLRRRPGRSPPGRGSPRRSGRLSDSEPTRARCCVRTGLSRKIRPKAKVEDRDPRPGERAAEHEPGEQEADQGRRDRRQVEGVEAGELLTSRGAVIRVGAQW